MLFIILEHIKKYHEVMDSRSRELAIETLEKALIENSRMLEILNFPDPGYKKIYLDESKVIGEALKLVDKKTRYAQQCRFIYGWDYAGSCDGERLIFDTYHEANDDLQENMSSLIALGHTSGDWRVAEYIEALDKKEDF